MDIQTGKLNGKQLNLFEIYDLTYQITMELITWITNRDDLMWEHFSLYQVEKRKDRKNMSKILGIRHAFNLFKHDMVIISLEEKRYSPFIKTEDVDCVLVQNVWLDIKDIPFDPIYKMAREAYVKNLQGKTLYETFHSIVDLLNRQYGKVITKN